MIRSEKQKAIDGLRVRMDRMTSLVLTDYTGMNVEKINVLRGEFRKAGVEYTVCKNTFIKKVIENRPFGEAMSPHLKGMTALAWSYEDPGAPARVLRDFHIKVDSRPLIKCAILGEQFVAGNDVLKTADLPTLPQARSMMLGLLQAPAQQLLSLLLAPARGLLNVIDARRRSLEETD